MKEIIREYIKFKPDVEMVINKYRNISDVKDVQEDEWNELLQNGYTEVGNE